MPAAALLLALSFALVAALAPVGYAQSSPEEDQDANMTAQTPDECVEPDPPSDNENAANYMDALERYDECLERTRNAAPEGENGTPAPGETSTNDPTTQNENATEPEECVEPPAPDDNDNARNYMDARDAYDECLERTGSGEGSTEEGDEDKSSGVPDCPEPKDDSVTEREKYQDCLDGAGAMEDDEPEQLADDPGGFTGMALGAFQEILDWLYGVTVEKPSKEMANFMSEEAFETPDPTGGPIGDFYQKVSNLAKPGALLAMLYCGYLMMFQGARYDSNVTVQNMLPKVFIFFAMIGFLPDLLNMLNDLTSGLGEAFVNEDGLEAFLSGAGSAGSHSGDDRAFMFILGHAVALVMMILIVFMTGLADILYSQLYVLSPLAILAWLFPQLSDLAAGWARAMLACILLPLVFAAEFAIGAVMINNPGSVFGTGGGNDSTLTALLITIVMFYIVWRTPKHMLSWAVTGYSAGSGMVSKVVKAAVFKKV